MDKAEARRVVALFLPYFIPIALVIALKCSGFLILNIFERVCANSVC